MRRHFTYVYFDGNLVPYYVGTGQGMCYLEYHRMPVPFQILIFSQDCSEAAHVFETYLIKRVGRRADCCGNRKGEKIGPLLNRNDGQGQLNPSDATRRSLRKSGARVGPVNGRRVVENGELARIRALRTPEGIRRNGRMGMHTRWHVERGLTKPDCEWCQNE